MAGATRKICSNGHVFYKSSDCPTCPVCEAEGKPDSGFLSLLGGPARRARENAGVTTLTQLSGWSESDLLKLHGMGPSSIPRLREALATAKLSFRGD